MACKSSIEGAYHGRLGVLLLVPNWFLFSLENYFIFYSAHIPASLDNDFMGQLVFTVPPIIIRGRDALLTYPVKYMRLDKIVETGTMGRAVVQATHTDFSDIFPLKYLRERWSSSNQ